MDHLNVWLVNLPFIVLGVAVIGYALLSHPSFSYQPQPAYVGARHALFGLFVAVLLTTVFAGLTLRSWATLQAFRQDPVCVAGIGARPSDSSALCSVRAAVVVGHHYSIGRRSKKYWVNLDVAGAGRRDVQLYRFSSAFWSGLNRGDRDAEVVVFRGDIVEIATATDSAKASRHPENLFGNDVILVVALAGASIVAALTYAFRTSS